MSDKTLISGSECFVGQVVATVIMQPTNIIARDGSGELLQLWHCQNTGKKEWRQILTLAQASKLYGAMDAPVIRVTP